MEMDKRIEGKKSTQKISLCFSDVWSVASENDYYVNAGREIIFSSSPESAVAIFQLKAERWICAIVNESRCWNLSVKDGIFELGKKR